ncbi:MAG: hypothetical protein AAGD09_26375, partial [Cyanobacteria bacterium P01_F01_bin.56]
LESSRQFVNPPSASTFHPMSSRFQGHLDIMPRTLTCHPSEKGKRRKAKGERQKAKGERQKEKGKRRKAKGERQKAEGKRRKAKGERQKEKGRRQNWKSCQIQAPAVYPVQT